MREREREREDKVRFVQIKIRARYAALPLTEFELLCPQMSQIAGV